MPSCELVVFGGAAKTTEFVWIAAPSPVQGWPASLCSAARNPDVGKRDLRQLAQWSDAPIRFRGVYTARVTLLVTSSSAATSSVDE